MKKLILILFLLPTLSYANTPDSVVIEQSYDIISELQIAESNGGEAIIHSNPSINNLLEIHISLNKKKKTYTGYRIQIHSVNAFGSDINNLKSICNRFEEHFQTIPAYLNYFNPDFKIRVGNYHSRLESIQDLHRIRKRYPSSYPVKTEISFEELKRIPKQKISVQIKDSIDMVEKLDILDIESE